MEYPDTDVGNVLAALARHGVVRVACEFDGGGDSGQMQGISEYEGIVEQNKLETVQVSEADWALVSHLYGRDNNRTLGAFIEGAAYTILNKSEYDWYNNDGGWGDVQLVPGEGRAFIDMNVRVTDSVNYEEDFSIAPQDDAEEN